MRSPSPRVRINRVDIYPGIKGQDADAGVKYTYAETPAISQVSCSVQFLGIEEIILEWGQDRVSQVNTFQLIFSSPQGLSPRDKIIWGDSSGNARTMFVTGDKSDEAGRGSTFIVKAIELL